MSVKFYQSENQVPLEMHKVRVVQKLFLLPDDVVVFPGHMEETTIGFEKRYNPIL